MVRSIERGNVLRPGAVASDVGSQRNLLEAQRAPAGSAVRAQRGDAALRVPISARFVSWFLPCPTPTPSPMAPAAQEALRSMLSRAQVAYRAAVDRAVKAQLGGNMPEQRHALQEAQAIRHLERRIKWTSEKISREGLRPQSHVTRAHPMAMRREPTEDQLGLFALLDELKGERDVEIDADITNEVARQVQLRRTAS